MTGGAGFIGSNICEAIVQMGFEVKCLDDLSTGFIKNIEDFMGNENFSFIEGDIKDYSTCLKATENIDYVLHQAAWGSVPRSIEIPVFYEQNNVMGTLNMLEASSKNKVKKFVYASSSSVYGDIESLPKVEGQEGSLLSPYALTKRVNEEYSKLYSKLYELDTYGLRYFNVFGEKQNPEGPYAAVIPKFTKQLINGETPIIFGDGDQSRDFTYVKNVVEANLKFCLASPSIAGEVFNIAAGGRYTLNEILKIIADMLNMPTLPQYQNARVGDIRHSNADISKAKKYINYSVEWTFEEGLKSYLDWYINSIKVDM